MTRYDYVIAGGGLAGLSLAWHLTHSPLRERSLLIVDRDAKDRNDRTWCYWADRPAPFDGIAFRVWDRLRILSEDFDHVVHLGGYRYRMIRGIDFYRHTRRALEARPNVEFVQGQVERVEDGADRARVVVNGRPVSAGWVFDSRFQPGQIAPRPGRYHYLKQHFKGWEIETPQDVFCPGTPTLFDFRTPQDGAMRFFYVLPFSARRALVEYTLFSEDLLSPQAYEQALRRHLGAVMGIDRYAIAHEESGVIPMTDQPFPRRAGRRVMTIGTAGGRVKPSSGYAFQRIQRDSAAIVRSLVEAGHPFDVPDSSPAYRLHDSVMLNIMARRGDLVKPLFIALFRHNPVERVFRFLDETSSQLENIPLLTSLPPGPFLRALFRLKVLRRT